MNKRYAVPFGLSGLIIALGIVFGDIGTSPLYVMKSIVQGLSSTNALTPDFVLGSMSCIIWTLTLQTTVKYILFTLRASNHGEGGVMALYTLVRRKYRWSWVLAAFGAAALIADGTITPAISILSAVEGVNGVFSKVPIIPITVIIVLALFLVQSLGTSMLGKYFGPVMVLWFLAIGAIGLEHIIQNPDVLRAFNPVYAARLIAYAPNTLLILGAVFLCTTGAEDLYADLGHCGLWNIRISWIFVKIMLICSYMGQTAWVLNTPEVLPAGVNPFFEIMPVWFKPMGVVLATIAAIIASQAIITGSFSIISEAVATRIWPRIKINYPTTIKGQMYIPSLNYILMTVCLLLVLTFESSLNLTSVYGLAIIFSMIVTSIMLFLYMMRHNFSLFISVPLISFFLLTEIFFLVANLEKFPKGGYISVIIAGIIFSVMVIWYKGKDIKSKFIKYDIINKKYLNRLVAVSNDKEIPKTATHLVYMTVSKFKNKIENKITHSLFDGTPKRADTYWFVYLHVTDAPYEFCYNVDVLKKQKIFRIDIAAGFKVEMHVEQFVQLIANETEKQGLVNLSSRYLSMKKQRGDFRFIVTRVILKNVKDSFFNTILLFLHSKLQALRTDYISLYDLDPTTSTIEGVTVTEPKYEEDDETLDNLVNQVATKSISVCINGIE